MNPNDNRYVIATIRPWNLELFHTVTPRLPGQWHLIAAPEELTPERLAALNPRYVFFPHWSRKVPPEIFDRYECVCFHETDLPYGRGGSPLQNLIVRGHTETVVTALRMVAELDAGPVYLKCPVALHGRAEEIYLRVAEIVYEMIAQIVATEPTPTPQKGEATIFTRRKPEQSEITDRIPDLAKLFDHIRMLDAREYPHAFIEAGGFRFEFTRPALRTGAIEADVKITRIEDTREKP